MHNKFFLCEKNTWKLDIARGGCQNSTCEEERFKNPVWGECAFKCFSNNPDYLQN